MANPLYTKDTFKIWMDKINQLVNEVDLLSVDGNINVGFAYDGEATIGLDAVILSGRVRSGSNVTSINTSTVTLEPNEFNVVCIYQDTEIRSYLVSALPEEDVIPLYTLETDDTDVLNAYDMRTQFVSGSNSKASRANSIVLFDQVITENFTVPADKNGLSVSPIIADGVEVVVEDGALWAVV